MTEQKIHVPGYNLPSVFWREFQRAHALNVAFIPIVNKSSVSAKNISRAQVNRSSPRVIQATLSNLLSRIGPTNIIVFPDGLQSTIRAVLLSCGADAPVAVLQTSRLGTKTAYPCLGVLLLRMILIISESKTIFKNIGETTEHIFRPELSPDDCTKRTPQEFEPSLSRIVLNGSNLILWGCSITALTSAACRSAFPAVFNDKIWSDV